MKEQIQTLIGYVNSNNKNIVGEYKNEKFKEMFNSMYLNYEYNKMCFYFNNEEITSIHLDKVISINKESNIVRVKTNNYNITLTFFNTDIDLPDIDFNNDIEDIFNDHNIIKVEVAVYS
jgi:hypothetical protein